MGTTAGYITVDWKKVENDLHETSEKVTRKLVEEQEKDSTRKFVSQVGDH